MPLLTDVHTIDGEVSVDDVAGAHRKDPATRHGGIGAWLQKILTRTRRRGSTTRTITGHVSHAPRPGSVPLGSRSIRIVQRDGRPPWIAF